MANMGRTIDRWAFVVGASVGMFWVYVVGTAMNLHTSLMLSWSVAMYVTCPVIRVILLTWWLVPLLNGASYVLMLIGVRALLGLRVSN